MIPIVVVGGDQPRSALLLRELIASGLFEMHIQPRISVDDLPKLLESAPPFKKFYGRDLSTSEKCCAFAHLQAQEKLAFTGGIILEDDAVILDYHQLAFYGKWATESKKSILLNLSTIKREEEVDWTFDENRLIRTVGPTALAVGYAASSLEMRRLSIANSSLKYLADWPLTSAKNFRLKRPIVAHGKQGTQSLISTSTNRQKIGFMKLVWRKNYYAAFTRLKQKVHFEATRAILYATGAYK